MRSKNNIYAVILAGGVGTRFWPVSRKSCPKQFLNITGKGTLLQGTLSRIRPLIKGSHVFIVTNVSYLKAIARQTARFGVPKANILLEPQGKNTAPAICWAAAKIHRRNCNAIITVLPSDHLILNERKFRSVLRQAIALAEKDHLVTMGIVPKRPETGYGYLKTTRKKVKGKTLYAVDRFTEKPSLAKAKQFIKRKGYLWNSGMFVWKTDVILNAYQKLLPTVYKLIVKEALRGGGSIRKVWPRLPNISIDYGILEKANNVVAVPAPGMQWSDLGSWQSLADILKKDKFGNTFRGNVVAVDVKDSLVWTDKKVIAAVGLDNLVVIDTPDALLVCDKDRSQSVKDIANILQKKHQAVT